MASITSTSSIETKQGPSYSVAELSKWVSLYRPEDTFSDEAPRAQESLRQPRLIILLSWMGATTSPVAKYIRAYQNLFPSTQILLLKSSPKHVTWRPDVVSPDVQPAVPVVRDAASTGTGGTLPQVLVHAFSNGGSAMLRHLRAAYGGAFPPHVTIFDSAPGQFTAASAVAAISAGLPPLIRAVLWPFLRFLALCYTVWFWRRDDCLRRHAKAHNAVEGEVRRTYIYSELDKMIDWKDVEEHAAAAEKKGYEVRREKFPGTMHVSHMRGNEERYWRVVKETWNGAKPVGSASVSAAARRDEVVVSSEVTA